MATAKKTQIRAQTQLNNETDVVGSDGHLILADGTVKMDSEYAISDRKAIAHSGFVAGRLSSLLGVADSLSASLTFSGSVAPLLNTGTGSTTFKDALITLANELDDQGLGTTSLQDEMDETQAGAGLAVDGQFVAHASSNYIKAADFVAAGTSGSIHNSTLLLDTKLKTTSDSVASIQSELDDTQLGAGLQPNGSYLAVGARHYIGAASSLDDADAQLDGQLKLTQDEVDAIEQAMGSVISAAGAYVAHTTTNYIDGNASVTEDLTDLDAKAKDLQDEVNAIETAMGAVVSAAGAYVAHTTSDYINGNSSVTEDLLDLDVQAKSLQDEVNAIEGAMGAVVSAAGAYVAHTTSNYIDGNGSVTEDLLDLDSKAKDIQDEVDAIENAMGSVIGTNGAYAAFSGKNYINGNSSVAEDLSDLDAQAKSLQDELDATQQGAGLSVAGAYVAVGGRHYIGAASSLDDADAKLDQALKDRVTDTADNADAAKGAALIGFKAYTGTAAASTDGRAHFAVAGGTVKSALEAIIEKLDVVESDDNVAGSVEYKIDQAVLAAIGGSAEMAGTLAQLSSSLNALDDEATSSLSASIQNMILEVKSDLRDSVHVSLDSFEKVAARIEAGDGSSLDTAASTLIEAVNENHTEIDAIEGALGAMISGAGAYVAFSGKNFINGNGSVAEDLIDLDAQAQACQVEVDAIETAMGAVISAAGAYVAHTTSNYIDGNGSVTEDLLDLDSKAKDIQDEVDAIEQALGSMVGASGAYAAFSGKNYINGNSDVAEDISDLDAAIGTALANMGLTSAGQIDLAAGDVRYIKSGASIETSVEGALDKLDQALDTLETAVIDTKSGNAAFVRKGDHLTEEFDASEGDTIFTISAEAHQESVMVFVNGMLQRMGASYDWQFGVSDDKIVLQQASEADDYVVIKYVKKTSA